MCVGSRWVNTAPAFTTTTPLPPVREDHTVLPPSEYNIGDSHKEAPSSSSGLGGGDGGNDDTSIGHNQLKYSNSGGYPTGNQNWPAGNRLPIKSYDLLTTKMMTKASQPHYSLIHHLYDHSRDRKYHSVGSGCAYALVNPQDEGIK